MKKYLPVLLSLFVALGLVIVLGSAASAGAIRTAFRDDFAISAAIPWTPAAPLADGNKACNPANCFYGCCDAGGVCQPGNADNACGFFAQTCTDCSATGDYCGPAQQCSPGLRCPPGYCSNGCCDANRTCHSGSDAGYCGGGGGGCVDCAGEGKSCDNGQCTAGACTPTTCPYGCCDPTGQTCYPGTADSECGSGGATCVACGGGQKCIDNKCQYPCTPSSCPDGCCNGVVCVTFSGQTGDLCGAGGAACASCGQGAACDSVSNGGQCTCDATTCPSGCCAAAECLPGNTDQDCGSAGGQCQACGAGTSCENGSCVSVSDDDDNDDNDDDDNDDNDDIDDDTSPADDDASPTDDDTSADDDASPTDDDDDISPTDDDTSPTLHPGAAKSSTGCGC